MKKIIEYFFKPTVRHLGRWNRKDNTFLKADFASHNHCGDHICKIPPKLKKPPVIKQK